MKFDGIGKLKKTSALHIGGSGTRIVYVCMDSDSKYYRRLFYKDGGRLHGTFSNYCIWRDETEKALVEKWEAEND